MPKMTFSKEWRWLEELATEVDALAGFYKKADAAAIICPNCETIQAYCTGCGTKLLDCYNEETASCDNCGISLKACSICGHLVESLEVAPEGLQVPELWKYCPACGEDVFAMTDMCPHCKVSMATHLDKIYDESYERVNRIVINEEMRQEGLFAPKKKPKEPFFKRIRKLLGL